MIRSRLAALAFVLAAAACGPSEPPVPPAQDAPEQAPAEPLIPAEVSAQLDSGTTAYRENDFQAALAHYTRATEGAPSLAAAWFGVYMAQQALGDSAAAQAALQKAQELDPQALSGHAPPSGPSPR